MIVLPFWTHAKWVPTFKRVMIRYMILDEPIYLHDDGNARPKPLWSTISAILPRNFSMLFA